MRSPFHQGRAAPSRSVLTSTMADPASAHPAIVSMPAVPVETKDTPPHFAPAPPASSGSALQRATRRLQSLLRKNKPTSTPLNTIRTHYCHVCLTNILLSWFCTDWTMAFMLDTLALCTRWSIIIFLLHMNTLPLWMTTLLVVFAFLSHPLIFLLPQPSALSPCGRLLESKRIGMEPGDGRSFLHGPARIWLKPSSVNTTYTVCLKSTALLKLSGI